MYRIHSQPRSSCMCFEVTSGIDRGHKKKCTSNVISTCKLSPRKDQTHTTAKVFRVLGACAYSEPLKSFSQHGICSVNQVMTLKGALMRLTANSARSVKQIIHGQQIMNGAVMIHSNTPITDSRKATSMNGKPMRNPSGLQLSHILPHAQFVPPAQSRPPQPLVWPKDRLSKQMLIS